jgi:hypothetical protein
MAVLGGNMDFETKRIQMEALGWMYAQACNMLDRGEDLRKVTVPELLERFHKDMDYD